MDKAASYTRTKHFVSGLVAASFCAVFLLGGSASSKPGEASAAGSAAQPTPTPAPFQLVAQRHNPASPQTDANCLLLNPQWGWQLTHAAASPTPEPVNFPDSIDTTICKNEDFSDCSRTQADEPPPQIDRPPEVCLMCRLGKKRPSRVQGHVNWFPATYTGTVCFHDLSYPDMDYTFSLQPDGNAGLTRWNAPAEPSKHPGEPKEDCVDKDGNKYKCTPKAFHVEFDTRETVERFRSEEWTKFRDLASPCKLFEFQSCKGPKARDHIALKRAVVIGLLGLDSEHNIYSELHPVYAIAIEMDESVPKDVPGNVIDSTWMIFARNTGDEGACSKELHPLYGPGQTPIPLTTLKLLIPPPPGRQATGVSFAEGTRFYSNNASCPAANYYDQLFPPPQGGANYTVNNQGVLLSFDLNNNDSCGDGCAPLVEGQLHLRWSLTGVSAETVLFKLPKQDTCTSLEELNKEERKKLRKPTPRQASALFELLLQARAEGLSMRAAECPYAGEVPGAPVLSACDSALTYVRQVIPASAGVLAARPRNPYADIINILSQP